MKGGVGIVKGRQPLTGFKGEALFLLFYWGAALHSTEGVARGPNTTTHMVLLGRSPIRNRGRSPRAKPKPAGDILHSDWDCRTHPRRGERSEAERRGREGEGHARPSRATRTRQGEGKEHKKYAKPLCRPKGAERWRTKDDRARRETGGAARRDGTEQRRTDEDERP